MHFEFHPNVKANTVATTDTNTPFDELMNPKKPPAVAAPAAPEGNTPFDDLIKTPAPPAPVVDPRGTVEDRMVPNPAARTAPPQPPQSMSDRLQEGATQVGLAYTKGADNAPTVLTPGAENVATAVGGVPAWLAIHGANNLLKAGAGGYSALQEGVRQVGNPVGKYLTGQPGLGDDVATALDILPAAKLEGLQAVKGAEIMRRGAFRDQLDKMTTAESTAVENAKTAEGYRKAADDALSSGARDAEIKQKAYQLWQQDGSKPGADPASYWQKAQDSLKGKPGETPKTPVTYMQKSGIDWDKVPKDELPTEKPTDPGTIKTANRIIDIGLAVGGSILGHYHYGYPGGAIGLIAGPFINEVRAKFGAKAADAVGKAIQQQARNPLGTGGEIERMGNPLPDQSAAP
jgi:hypothetical protein